MLVIKDLKKSFGKVEVLHGINLTIDKGEIFAFIGHNGAGKTTTIKCIAGILQFDSGEIYIEIGRAHV